MRKIIATIVNCILFTALTFSQTTVESGSQAIINYTSKEYGADNQNWAITQDAKGILYVANSGGMMTFDGVGWKIYPLPNKFISRCLAIGDSGKIYAGTQGDLGYFQPDAAGRLNFHSLLNYIPKANRDFVDVWNLFVTNSKVYFNAQNYLFIWDIRKQKFSVIPSKDNFHLMFLVDGKIYMREWKKGLEVLQNDSLQLVKGGEQFADERVYVMLPFPGEPGKSLVVTRTMGLFKYDGYQFIPFKTEADEFL